jgi:GH18 family chitinase
MFYAFSLYDPVDEPGPNHRIFACSSFGPDFSKAPVSTMDVAPAEPVDVQFEIGWWKEGFGLAAPGLRSLIKQMRHYIEGGHGATDRPFLLFGQSGQATIGLYIGQGLLNQGLSDSALALLHDKLGNLNMSTPSLAMQLCGPDYDSTHIFGVAVASNGTFGSIQDAVRTWANGTCLSFSGSTQLSGQAMFTTPLLRANDTANANSTISARRLEPRAECRTIQVVSGDSCGTLASRCGISGADFMKYNPGSSFCSTLMPKQHVCCSSGDLPDFRPKPNADGSCYSYETQDNDNCAALAAAHSLTIQDLEDFNKKTWGWSGCNPLRLAVRMCLSTGYPPFPAEISNAVCGPQKPGTQPPTGGADISQLNPCPLNACCNIWGQCGLTKDFCIDTNTGPPGTAAPGTYGCISNCGMDIIRGTGTGAIKIAYFQGYGLSRECLFQDALQIDTSKYTHIHFGFGTLTSSYQVQVGDVLSKYQFWRFKSLTGVKRILAFGGWTFSTDPETYFIFREGVKPANRLTMATNIANFIKVHNLDGVDIDWEYPGAPDIPGIPKGEPDEGTNYFAFLVVLKNLLPGKTVSIAAPASYHYLKQYPIQQISRVVDYIVFMTYDLHGQWDATGSEYMQEGCKAGNCLRSHVNLTETRQALAMITKAGVPGHKIIVGVSSYGRSFKMAEAGCWGPGCLFTGDQWNSNAKKGRCTGTAGYLADAEIAEILNDPSRVVTKYVDLGSNSDVLVYDGTEYVAYMGSTIKGLRSSLYAAWGLGGTTDWASDLQQFHPVPKPQESWNMFKQLIYAGKDPGVDHTRYGGWAPLQCTEPATVYPLAYTTSERWELLKADAAWADIVRIYKDTDSAKGALFMSSVAQTLQMASAECGTFGGNDTCDTFTDCPPGANGDESGPAAELIWNSLVKVHRMYHSYYDELTAAAGTLSMALDDMENTFAPIPQPEDDTWLQILLNLATLGTMTVAAPIFNGYLRGVPYWAGRADNVKDGTFALIGAMSATGKDLLQNNANAPWTDQDQDKFSHYMSKVVKGWLSITERAVGRLFYGSRGKGEKLTDSELDTLYNLISDGKLVVDGKWPEGVVRTATQDGGSTEMRANIEKTFFGFSIPALWRTSKNYVFVIDSGFGCDADKPLDKYLRDDTMDATGACVDGRRYYMVHPVGKAYECYEGGCADNVFSAPPGIERLSDFGNITKEELIRGSVRTWMANGKRNGGGFPDVSDRGTADALMTVDVTTPGFVRLPVCSPEVAFKGWEWAVANPTANYPCDPPLGLSYCGNKNATLPDDETSAISPLVDDCLALARRISVNPGTSYTVMIGYGQREVDREGSCRFGAEPTWNGDNIYFRIGGQDVIDIINDAVKRFGGIHGGRVGAYGYMDCEASSLHKPWHGVKWGIY